MEKRGCAVDLSTATLRNPLRATGWLLMALISGNAAAQKALSPGVTTTPLPWSTRSFDRADGLPLSPILAMERDPMGTLWLGTEGEGLFSWNGSTVRPVNGFGKGVINSIELLEDSVLAIASDVGLHLYRPYPPVQHTLFEAPGFPMVYTAPLAEKVWVAADGWGVGHWTAQNGLQRVREEQARYTGVVGLSDGALVWGSNSGLWHYTLDTLIRLQSMPILALVSVDGVSYAYADASGVTVVARHGTRRFPASGVQFLDGTNAWYCIVTQDSLFRIDADARLAEAMGKGSFEWVRSFAAGNDEVLLGGLGRLEVRSAARSRQVHSSAPFKVSGLSADPGGFNLNGVDGIWRWTPEKGRLTDHLKPGMGLVLKSFERDERLWVATETGVYSGKSGSLLPLLDPPSLDFAFDAEVDQNGVWVAGVDGLYRAVSGKAQRIEGPGLREIELDVDGALYGLSFASELVVFERGTLKTMGPEMGAFEGVGFARDRQGRLWGCSAAGTAHRWNQGRWERSILRSDQGRLIALTTDADGRTALLFEYALLLGALNSEGVFDAHSVFLPGTDYELNTPDGVQLGLSGDRLWMFAEGRIQEFRWAPPTPIPPPVLSSFETAVGLKNALSGRGFALVIEPFTLPYHSSYIRIGLGDGPGSNPGRWNYRFELIRSGSAQKVQSEGTEALFPTLEAGRYQLKMWRIENGTGRISAPLELEFTIVPPLWQRWWFVGLVSLGLGLMAAQLVKLRIDKVRERSRMERELITLESTALRLQMNPHFIFNALDSISAFIFRNDPAQATRYLSSFARLMRATLDSSHESFIPLSTELQVLRSYLELERLRTGEILEFSIECPEEWVDALQVPPMVIQPYVENAVKHGLKPLKGQGHISVRFGVEGPLLRVVVDDTGVGRAAARAMNERLGLTKTSKGMGITERRLELLRKAYGIDVRIEIEDKVDASGQALGTRVHIALPLVEIEA